MSVYDKLKALGISLPPVAPPSPSETAKYSMVMPGSTPCRRLASCPTTGKETTVVGPIILDCDPGTDDAFALLLALASPELQVAALTVALAWDSSGRWESVHEERDDLAVVARPRLRDSSEPEEVRRPGRQTVDLRLRLESRRRVQPGLLVRRVLPLVRGPRPDRLRAELRRA